jgi:hypothetical protein
MAPPSAATAAPVRRHVGGASPSRRGGRGAGTAAPSPETRRPPLRVIPGRLRPGTKRGRRPAGARATRTVAGRGRLLHIASVSLVVAALLAVVAAQAMLANGQVRLSSLQHQLSLEQGTHRQAELAVSELETPSRIVATATGLGMVRPANVVELPYVSLAVPLPTPKVTPAPPAPAPAPAPAHSAPTSQSTGTAGTTATSTTTATSIP